MGKHYSGYKKRGFFLACLVTLVSFFGVIATSATSLAPTPNMDWSPATLVETGTGSTSSPKIAVDPTGNVMAVWVQWNEAGTIQSIYANRYVVGSGWGTATLLETSDLPVSSPQIAVDSNGNAIAVWAQAWATGNNTPYGIYAKRYVAGTGWGTVTTVYADTKKDYVSCSDPRIAVDPNGNYMAVWALYDPSWSHTSVWASRYVVGTGWAAATNLSGDVVQTSDSAKVALDSIGNAIVVWVQGFGSDRSIYANRYTVGTGWGTTVHIGTSPANRGEVPQIGFNPNGNAIAVWVHSGKPGISANRYVAGTGWGTAESIIDSGNTSYSQGVQIAFDKNGNAIAVWNQYGGKLSANRYVTGTGWGTTDIVDSEGQNYSAQIAFDSNGNAIAVWGKYASNSSNIWASRYVVGTGWGAGAIIHSVLDHAGDPQIVINKNGNATVVWVQGSSIFDGSIYASNGSLATPTPTPSPTATPTPTPKSSPTPSSTPTPAATPTPVPTSTIIFSNDNIYGVSNGPTVSTTFFITQPYVITSILTYHHNSGTGKTAGTIGLHSNSKTYGPWQATGYNEATWDTSDTGGNPQRYWVVKPKVTINAGSYTVDDSDTSSWSQNSTSGFQGIAVVKGYLATSTTTTPTPTPSSTPSSEKGSISGDITDTEGNPIESAKISLKGKRTKVSKRTTSDEDGFFEFTDLSADTYTISATRKGYKKGKQVVTLEKGEDADIEIEMQKTGKGGVVRSSR